MAVTLFDNEETNIPDVPWIGDWTRAKANDGTAFTCTHLIVRPKGIMAFASEFKVFIWKSEKIHNQLLEHVGKALTPENPLHGFVLVPVKAHKRGYLPGFDDELKGSWVEDGNTYTFQESLTAPSNEPTLPLSGSGMNDASPKTGRRAS